MAIKELKFDANLDFQQKAIEAITSIFAGQKICSSNFSVRATEYEKILQQDILGYANQLELMPEEILENVKAIQLENNLKPSDIDLVKTMNFSIQMETGTGKTYVYLRTIFELNKLYGWTKFIIVVPSIAIKEGVYSSLELMTNHFKAQYNNTSFDYFIYDSGKLNQVRNFAVSSNIQIMIINIDAFRKVAVNPAEMNKANIIHRYHDKMLGKPIDFIASCNPVVIIDEPQSVDSTDKAKEALKLLNPLCTLRYSATHREADEFCKMYKLDSIDALEKKLVKEIFVQGVNIVNNNNTPYVKLVSTGNQDGTVYAKIEIDVLGKSGIQRKTIKVKANDNLFNKSGNRGIYSGWQIDDISCREGDEYIYFLNQTEPLRINQALGGANDDVIKRQQIKKTIEEHLDRELRLKPLGIKVLSLFFIDLVKNYRDYEAEGAKGKYAVWFEEEYNNLIRRQKYESLSHNAEEAHDGYFSIDKNGNKLNKTSESTQADRENAERGYQLIMKSKRLLLSFDSPVRFIFSHSALKEGWDNPNVFQICTLNETSSDMRRRQMVGRGLRICVNQDGDRVTGDGINTLTVMANESFADFASKLQHEIEEEEHIKFGMVEEHSFANITVINADGQPECLGLEKSKMIFQYLKDQGFILPSGTAQNSLKENLNNNSMIYPLEFNECADKINAVLKKICGKLNIKNRDEATRVTLKKERFLSPEFKELWDKIKYKTTYRVNFDQNALIDECVRQIADESKLVVDYPKFVYGKGKVEITPSGVVIVNEKNETITYKLDNEAIPDVISYLQNETNLTRRTLANILDRSNRLDSLIRNPQMFLDGATAIIKKVMANFLADGIEYHKLDNDIWAQELLENDDLVGFVDKNMIETPNHGIYDYTFYDSDTERNFAQKLESTDDVKVFVKLPNWFKIPTPLGTYNPDWAIVVEKDGQRRLYFVVETKGTNNIDDLTSDERNKIKCGKAHFRTIAGDGLYQAPIKNYDSFDDKVNIELNR